MSLVVIDRLEPRVRPTGRPAGYHRWSELLFMHWRISVNVLRPLLPPTLEIDQFDGTAWVGLVAFHMSGVRPWWSPAMPGLSEFHETNVRTYVVHRGQPGVWFFSLEAAQSLAVRIARWRWRLNYFRAAMEITRRNNIREYRSQRLWPPPVPAHSDVAVEIGDWLFGTEQTGAVAPGTLEFFLVERYLLFTELANRRIARGQVHHRPYPLKTASLLRCDQSLLAAAGIDVASPPEHVIFSPGVDVEVFPLRAV